MSGIKTPTIFDISGDTLSFLIVPSAICLEPCISRWCDPALGLRTWICVPAEPAVTIWLCFSEGLSPEVARSRTAGGQMRMEEGLHGAACEVDAKGTPEVVFVDHAGNRVARFIRSVGG